MTETEAQQKARLKREIAFFRKWAKWLINDWRRDEGMPKNYSRDTATCVALGLALDGHNGMDSYTSAERTGLARIISPDIARKYKAFLIRDGVLVDNGRRNGRLVHVDIAIPDSTGWKPMPEAGTRQRRKSRTIVKPATAQPASSRQAELHVCGNAATMPDPWCEDPRCVAETETARRMYGG